MMGCIVGSGFHNALWDALSALNRVEILTEHLDAHKIASSLVGERQFQPAVVSVGPPSFSSSVVLSVRMMDWDQFCLCPALPQQMMWPSPADLGQPEINISPLKSIRGELGRRLSEATPSRCRNIKPDTCSTRLINI